MSAPAEIAVASLRGRFASSPWAIPAIGWKEVALRTLREAGEDNIGIIAAGVAFYGFLALVPVLGAIVLSYGIVAEPKTVVHDMQNLTSIMPADAARLVGEQLMNVVKTSTGKKGFGVAVALAIALFGARNGAGSVVTALNIAYEEKEERGFIKVNLLALGITVASVLVAVIALVVIAALSRMEDGTRSAPTILVILGRGLSYFVLVLVGAAGAATLYRYGPSRQKPRWRWLTPGSVLVAILWLLLTSGFGIYVAHFGNYNVTYGSLGAVVVLLTWLYLSSYALLFGAELNSELERQTGKGRTGSGSAQVDPASWSAAQTEKVPLEGAPDLATNDLTQSAPRSVRSDVESISLPTNFVVARVCSRVAQTFGIKRIGLISSALATTGLALIRRRGAGPQGAALLAASAGLAWISRER